MTTTYKCDLCKKIFKQKGDYTKHIKRTSACVSLDKLKNIVSDNKFNETIETILFEIESNYDKIEIFGSRNEYCGMDFKK